jgi:hypothetical protein
MHSSVVTAADGQRIAARFFRPEGKPRGIGHFGFFRAAYEASLWRQHLLPELA